MARQVQVVLMSQDPLSLLVQLLLLDLLDLLADHLARKYRLVRSVLKVPVDRLARLGQRRHQVQPVRQVHLALLVPADHRARLDHSDRLVRMH